MFDRYIDNQCNVEKKYEAALLRTRVGCHNSGYLTHFWDMTGGHQALRGQHCYEALGLRWAGTRGLEQPCEALGLGSAGTSPCEALGLGSRLMEGGRQWAIQARNAG